MATSMYLWFTGGPKGTATASEVKGKNAVNIISFQHETQHPAVASSTGQVAPSPQGYPKIGDFKVTKYIDETTPPLSLACAGGTVIPTATIAVFVASQKAASSAPILAMQYDLTNAFVTNIETGSKGMDMPVETITFSFSKILWTFTPMDNKTGAVAPNFANNWDINLNTGS